MHGKSPMPHFQDLRIERAKHLVSIGFDVETTPSVVGFANAATLRNLMNRRLGRDVRDASLGNAAIDPNAQDPGKRALP